MRLLTRFELAAKNTETLYRLRSEIFNALGLYPIGSIARSNALASLENIQYELLDRTMCCEQ